MFGICNIYFKNNFLSDKYFPIPEEQNPHFEANKKAEVERADNTVFFKLRERVNYLVIYLKMS